MTYEFLLIPDWQREILKERLEDLDRNPDDEQSWEEVKAEIWPGSLQSSSASE
jgi:hypothetical protein